MLANMSEESNQGASTSGYHDNETPPRPSTSGYHDNETPARPAQGISRHYVFDEESPTTHLTPNSDTKNHVTGICQKTSENLHLLVNETSLACYRIQEHIERTVPHLNVCNCVLYSNVLMYVCTIIGHVLSIYVIWYNMSRHTHVFKILLYDDIQCQCVFTVYHFTIGVVLIKVLLSLLK